MNADSKPFDRGDEPVGNLVARFVREPSSRVETRDYIIHRHPRISANKLGEYLVADESRKKTILKESKKAKKAVVLHYNKTRLGFINAFKSDGFDGAWMKERAARIRSSIGDTDWEREDNRMSADALEKVASIIEKLPLGGAEKIARPEKGWGGLDIEGVRVSVNPDIVFSTSHRGVTKVGAVILYTTKDDAKSLGRYLGDNKAGDYVAALLLRLLEAKLANTGVPYPAKCFVVDVHRSEVYTAPSRFKTLFKHIEAACEGISSRWGNIEV